ncbi:unnamed protein product (macronuclear) [Paramecium tetraurelia]|uniref:Uncharacterized protein n=1 Tax=Paramecium tetraurelia TaxID=5888 RepID=A0CJN9_PARTE|nr:uncharacterized protein GSPATT00000718001 [Paramecium tetraurelia]CAK71006.1 unnamed protein product [Paramecium tetraurelia]|eukprot:XP_001438403.1 hypothetical protein (macronuclear) [Paramecium tetraurelia strain d4-2]
MIFNSKSSFLKQNKNSLQQLELLQQHYLIIVGSYSNRYTFCYGSTSLFKCTSKKYIQKNVENICTIVEGHAIRIKRRIFVFLISSERISKSRSPLQYDDRVHPSPKTMPSQNIEQKINNTYLESNFVTTSFTSYFYKAIIRVKIELLKRLNK